MSGWPYSDSNSFCTKAIANGYTTGNGVFNNFSSLLDANGMAYISMMRNMGVKPNQDPSQHTNYNYGYLDSAPVNRWDGRVKVDYSINANTKLSGTYSEQQEKDTYRYGNMYWWPGGAVPYPSTMSAQILSRTVNANLTKSFTPTLTNDFTFAMSYFTLPAKPDKASAIGANAIGTAIDMPYSLSDAGLMSQFPNILSWACNTTGQQYGCFPQVYAYAFENKFNGAVGNIKKVPTLADNLSKTWKTHTVKLGFYWEQDNQTQSDLLTNAQGQYEFDPWNIVTTGNPLVDLLMGNVSSFTQNQGEPLTYVKRYDWGFYLTDQWKVKKLTLNYGVRLEHNGQWFADNGAGLAVWADSAYVNDPASASGTSGVLWHSAVPSVPLSGWRSKLMDVSPRVGVAYDIFGNGKTVVRGGFGVYRWQVSIGDATGSYLDAEGIGNVTKSGFSGMSNLSDINAVAGSLAGSDINVLKSGDAMTPYTNNWNVIVSQATPWKSTLELQYQGSHTDNSVISNNNNSQSSLANYNKIPMGTLLSSAECIANASYCGSKVSGTSYTSSPSATDQMYYRPYKDYLMVTQVNHGSYANYHAFVAQWQRQSGSINWIVNYTFGKVLGIQDGNSENGNGNGNLVNPFNLRDNYGVLAYDHTQIFNATYVYHTPNVIHDNPLLAGAVNGWEFSGITQMQSGAPLQSNSNRLNFSAPVSVADVLGTPDAILMPRLTCNPNSGLKSGQYFNPSCFDLPIAGTAATAGSAATLGTNGQYQWPYLRGPAFVSSDLALMKNFKFRERQNVQFRFSAFNFLNHKLKQFGTSNDDQLIMTASSTASKGFTLPSDFTGKPEGITGRRVMEFALKYEF
jgi:hypothetical protein